MASEFTLAMKAFFRAKRGAYSPVTKNEFDKHQITFTGPEQQLAEDFLGSELDKRHGSIDDI